MKIIDGHTHTLNYKANIKGLIEKMDNAGVWGSCIFSNYPDRTNPEIGTSFDERLYEILSWTDGYKDRLFPVLWVHPHEKDVFSNVKKAVDSGVIAFKMICSDYYVYDQTSMKLLSYIAEMGKAVFFHTGILWDGKVSSNYNRPLNWEHLLKIKNLRFSMGHCSWPWHDECIALYGKFLNSIIQSPVSCEMFFDITPGTPRIYRRELITKLLTIGYDVPDNIFFGTDSMVDNYNNGNWVASWINFDNKIYDELGIADRVKNKIYNENILRFLGINQNKVTHKLPDIDNSNILDVNSER